jgi:uncharacterized membrane protein YdjX (TVP38/TMEM64 family)
MVQRERAGWGWALLKGGLLVAFLLGALTLLRLPEVGAALSKERLRAVVEAAGPWAPVAHVLLYAAGVTAFLPGSLLTAVGAIAFGKLWGTLYNLLGATLGAGSSFLVGRYLGRDLAGRLIRGRLQALDEGAERNGFALIFYLRIVFFPFTPLNFGAGLTRIRFGDFMLGTFLGILPGTFVLTYFLDELTNLRSAADLLDVKFLVPLTLFVGSLFLPRLVGRLRKGAEAL